MESKDTIDFKVHLKMCNPKFCYLNIVRRMLVKKVFANNFQYMENKIRSSFPEVGCLPIQILWNDSEDMVCISSDEEMALAISVMKEPIKKLYIKCEKEKHSHTAIHEVYVNKANMLAPLRAKCEKQRAQQVTEPTTKSENIIATVKYMDCIERLDNIIRDLSHIAINPDGSLADCFDDSKMEFIQSSLKRLEFLVIKLMIKKSSEKDIHGEGHFPVVKSLKRLAMNAKKEVSCSGLINIDCEFDNEAVPGKHSSQPVDDDEKNAADTLTKDDMDCGASVQTLSEISSEDEMEKWTILDGSNHQERASLQDTLTHLENSIEKSKTESENTKNIDSENVVPSENTNVGPHTSQNTGPVQRSIAAVKRAIFPHIAAGLEILYSMGFKDDNDMLVDLLETHDGNVEKVLDVVLFDKKNN